MKRKLILKNFLSPGDIVMLTAAVRDLHRCYPNRFITDVRTSCPGLWENNPYLTPLDEAGPKVEVVDCQYPLINRANQAPYHCLHGFIEFLNDHLGLQIKPTAFKGDIHLSALEKSWYSQVHELTGEDTPFWIVVSGGKHDMTIKWWDPRRYQEVVDYFRGKVLFVQVGESHHHHPKLDGVIDLRGKTDLRQLVRLVYHAQGVLCPVTCLMHLAATMETKPGSPTHRPCVVVAGGREPVHWEAYPHHQFVHTIGALPCCQAGGCWRSRTVPLGDGDERDDTENLCVSVVEELPRCMDMISASEIIRRIESYFNGGVIEYLTPTQARAAKNGIALSNADTIPDEPPLVSTVQPSDTVLIQQASGFHVQLLDVSANRHAAYSARHGLTFWSVRGDVQSERPPVWNKIILIQKALRMGFETIVWLDADTLIVDLDKDVRQAMDHGAPIGMCRHPLPWRDRSWHFNAGVIVVRNTKPARRFFDAVWRLGPVEHLWQEQARINELAQKFPRVVQRLHDKWNSTQGVNACRAPVIRAWHGQGPEALGLMRAALFNSEH